MVTTRDLEQSVEDALREAGASEQSSKTAALKLGDEIVQLATRDDLQGEIGSLRQEMKDEFLLVRQEMKQEIEALRRDLTGRIDAMERTMWRLAWLGFAMWSATFGALMYAVFG